jgi:hypothetical protein
MVLYCLPRMLADPLSGNLQTVQAIDLASSILSSGATGLGRSPAVLRDNLAILQIMGVRDDIGSSIITNHRI